MSRVSAWWSSPWRPPRILAGLTIVYLLWSLLPVVVAVIFSFNAGKSRTVWQGFSMRWYYGDPIRSIWHDPSLHTALTHTLVLGVLSTIVTVPLGVAFALGIDRWRGRLPAGANFTMLLSFVLPETLMAVALLFLITQVATPLKPGTDAQIIGLVTFQLSYPVVIVRARLLTIGKQYEEAAQDLGASSIGAVRRVLLPMLMPGHLRQHRPGFRRCHRRLRDRPLPLGRLLDRAGVGEDLQHRSRRSDTGAQRAGHHAAALLARGRRAGLRDLPAADPR